MLSHNSVETHDNSKVRVLIVDAEKGVARELATRLQRDGIEVACSTSAADAENHICKYGPPSLLLLDMLLPDRDGYELALELRRIRQFPIVCLSSINDADLIASAIDTFADDFVIKPCQPDELVARIRRLLSPYRVNTQPPIEVFVDTHLQVNLTQRFIIANDRRYNLTPTETRLLETFLKNRGQVLSPKELIKRVWSEKKDTSYSALAINLYRLRNKLESTARSTPYIVNIHGMGYQFVK